MPSRLILAVAATIATLLAIELCVRATYVESWYAQPSFPDGHTPRLNRDNLRDVDYGPKTPGTYRVLVLGDSFTFGSGVTDDAAIWPAIVERRLTERRPLPNVDRYELLNGGLPGSMTPDWVKLFATQRDRFEPDLVLVVFFLRDGVHFENEALLARLRDRARPAWPWLHEVSYAYRYLRERRAALGMTDETIDTWNAAYTGTYAETSEWRRAQNSLLSLRNMARERSRFGLVGFPVLFGLDRTPYPFAPVLEALERFCGRNGIPYRSLLPAFAGQDARALWVAVGNQHPNARGHALAADAIYDVVVSLAAP